MLPLSLEPSTKTQALEAFLCDTNPEISFHFNVICQFILDKLKGYGLT